MGIIQTWSETTEGFGEWAGNFSRNVANVAADTVCSLYDKYPKNWLISPYTRGFMDSVCGYRDSGSDTELELGSYAIRLTYRFTPRFATEPTEFREFFVYSFVNPYVGSIRSVSPVLTGDGQLLDTQVTNLDDQVVQSPNRLNVGSGGVIDEPTLKYTIIPVPPVYDPETVDPDDINFSREVVTNVNEGDEITTNLDISVAIDDNDSFTFPTTINIGGLDINIGFDGFSSPDGDGGGGTGTPSSDSDGSGSPSAEDGGKIKSPFIIEDFNRSFEGNPDPDPEEEPPEVTEEESEDDEVVWVLITITQLPSKGKTILQPNADNNTYMAGYFRWTVSTPAGVYSLPEVPIRKRQMAIPSPLSSAGYKVYTVNGAKISVTQYKEKE